MGRKYIKMEHTYTLTEGRPSKIILKFYFPMLLTSMLQQVYTIADTAIVGKGLGDNPLAAVGNMSSLTFFVMGFALGLSNGFAVMISQYYGADDIARLRRSIAASTTLSGIIIVIFTTLSIALLKPMLIVMKTSDIIIKDSLLYGYIIFGGFFATVAYNLCSCILRSLGDSRTPFIAIIFSTIFNIVFNCVFVFGLKSGVEGPAIVTVISQLISATICYVKLKKIELIRLCRDDFKGNGKMYLKLLKNGIPMAAMNSVTAVGCMIVQSFVNGMGVAYTAAYSACSKYINLFMQPACTAGNTMSTFTGQNYGAKKYDRIRQGLGVCLSIAAISYILLGSLMIIFPDWLASLMLNGDFQIELAKGFLIRCGIAIFAVDFLFVFRSACQGMERPLIPMLSGVFEMVLRISVIVVFTKSVGFNATAYAEVAAWSGALIVNLIAYYYYINKLEKQ